MPPRKRRVAVEGSSALTLRNLDDATACRRLDDRFQHSDAVFLVAPRQRERTSGGNRVGEVFQLGAFRTDLGKCNELRPLVCGQMLRIDKARAHLPGREVLYVAD